jgi:hypothetical protein
MAMRDAATILADAAGTWGETLKGLAQTPLRAVTAIIAVGAVDETAVRLLVAIAQSLPPEAFERPENVLLFRFCDFVVTLVLCAASVAAGYFLWRSLAREAAPLRFGRWMRRATMAWFGILAGSGLFALGIQFFAMASGLEGGDGIDPFDWLSGFLYACVQALLASVLLLRLPEAGNSSVTGRSPANFQRKSLFAAYFVLFLATILVMYVIWPPNGSLTMASLRTYYGATSLSVLLSVLLSCTAARRFAAAASRTATIFE